MKTVSINQQTKHQAVFVTVVLAAILFCSYCTLNQGKLQGQILSMQQDLDLLKLSSIVRHSVIAAPDHFKTAVRLRNHVYQNVPLRPTSPDFDHLKFTESYKRGTRNKDFGHYCEGLAATYISVLESQGIPARYIGMVTSNQEPYESHVSVEFWYKGKWHASDPTFNIMLKHEGKYISYERLYKLLKENKQYEIVTDGPVKFGRELENYHVELAELMNYVVVHPATVVSEGEVVSQELKLYPKGWNGRIQFADGKSRNVTQFRGIYDRVSTGLLR